MRICSRETPPELVARLAYQKAANVIEKIDAGIVLAADTVAECVGIILGKPESRDHAREMLRRLRAGSTPFIVGYVCVDKRTANRSVSVDASRLWMDPITDDESKTI